MWTVVHSQEATEHFLSASIPLLGPRDAGAKRHHRLAGLTDKQEYGMMKGKMEVGTEQELWGIEQGP